MSSTQVVPIAAPAVNCQADPLWLDKACELMRSLGFVVVEAALPEPLRREARSAMFRVRERILEEVGPERLARAGEIGVMRLPLRHDPVFMRFLEIPPMLALVDRLLSPTAVLHLQNGLILPPSQGNRRSFQTSFHLDFPRVVNGYLMSVNFMFAIDEFRADNGATLFLPGSHQLAAPPDLEALAPTAVSGVCPAGSMILFDSTCYHAAGDNRSGDDRIGLNQQFTRSYLKQQLDCVRCCGNELVLAQAPRTQLLLGWYTRVPANLDEYYRPPGERFYRAGQG